jgi:hypothetical protein
MTTSIGRTGDGPPLRHKDPLATATHRAAHAREVAEGERDAGDGKRVADAAHDRILRELQLAGQTHASARRQLDVIG